MKDEEADGSQNGAYRLYKEARGKMDRGDLESAARMFQEALALESHFKALELLGECYIRLKRPGEAVVPLAAATTLNKGVRAPALLAEVFLALGDTLAAEEMSDLALSRDPQNRRALQVKKAVLSSHR